MVYLWGKKGLLLLLSALLMTSLTAQAQPADRSLAVIPAGETVKIGIASDLTNILPTPGLDIAQAASLAITQFNAAGGLLGFDIEAVIEDDRCTPDDAQVVAEEFVEEETLVAVVGHMCSGASIRASEIYEVARIPMVSASSTANSFTSRGLDVVNRVAFNDNVQGEVAGRYIVEVLAAQRVVVLHNRTDYGRGLAQTVAATVEGLGATVVLQAGIDPASPDYEALLTLIARFDPDLIYLGGYDDEAAVLVEQMDGLGMGDVIFFSDDGVYNQDFLDFAGEFADGTYVTFGVQVGDLVAYDRFVHEYEMEYGVQPNELGPYNAQAYDAAQLILNALVKVAELDGENLTVDREALIREIRRTENYPGLSGIVTCDRDGDCGSAEISVYIAYIGRWVKVGVPYRLQVKPN